jgi:hypothetical protein
MTRSRFALGGPKEVSYNVFKALSDPKSPGYAQIRNPKARGLDDIGLGPEFELEPAEAASEPEGVTA